MDYNSSEPDESNDLSSVYLIPTSHASEKSSKIVSDFVLNNEPDIIAVELDKKRLEKLLYLKQNNVDMTKSKTLREVYSNSNLGYKGTLLAYIFGKIQKNISQDMGIDFMGIDMISGVESANKLDKPIALIDVESSKTFQRLAKEMSFREYLRLVKIFGIGYLEYKKSKEEVIQNFESEQIDVEEAVNLLGEISPTLKRILIDNRNEYMCKNISALSLENSEIAVVIGAGHTIGMYRILCENPNLDVSIHSKSIDFGISDA